MECKVSINHLLLHFSVTMQNNWKSAFQNYRDYTNVAEFSAVIMKTKEIKPAADPEFVARIDATCHPLCEINKLTKEAITLKRSVRFHV